MKNNLVPFEEKVLAGLVSCGVLENPENSESLRNLEDEPNSENYESQTNLENKIGPNPENLSNPKKSGNLKNLADSEKLKNLGNFLSENKIGAAVSGGADSVSLLLSFSKILEKIGMKNRLKVITVNHGIREKTQTDGDALFVQNLCENLGISCKVVSFAQGEAEKNAEKRGKGLEEAAREMRYKAFYDFIAEKNLSFLCLAHNQNDQTETILMRLLKGSGSEGLGGIPKRRGKIIRPLLDISRVEIESYLVENKISWRTDSTNFENKYARNKIRNVLVPFLDENFAGWKDSVLISGQKAFDDNSFLQKCAENEAKKILKSVENGGGKIVLEWKTFCALDFALQRRIIYLALNKLGFGERFPFRHVKEICGWKNEKLEKKCVLTFEKLKISLKNQNLEFEISENKKNRVSFGYNFVFTDENDFFEYEKMKFYLEKRNGENCDENAKKIFLCVESCGKKCECEVQLPFYVGSFQPGEKIRASDGKLKNISDIFSDWKISESGKCLIPVVRVLSEKSGKFEAATIFGFAADSKNWKVQDL